MPEEGRIKASDALRLLNFFRSAATARERAEETRRREEAKNIRFLMGEERKRREFAMGKMAQYMNGLSEGPSKELARLQFKDYYDKLPDYEKEVLAPSFTRLFSPTEEKEAEFERLRGKPINPGIVDPTTDPVTRAKLEFANADYLVDRDSYVLGIDRGRTNTIPIGENQWAWRDKEGKMGILSREGSARQEWVQKTLDKAEMTWDMAMAQGGDVPTAAPRMITDGQMQYEVTPLTNILTKAKSFRKIPMGRPAQSGERKLPQVLSDFSTSFTMGEGVTTWQDIKGGAPVGAVLYDRVQNELDALEELPGPDGKMIKYSTLSETDQARVVKRVIRGALGTHMAGWNIEVHAPGEFKSSVFGYDRFAESDYGNIYFIPGKIQPFFNSNEELVGAFYWDEEFDVVRDSFNQVKGTKAELDAMASGLPKGAWFPEEKK